MDGGAEKVAELEKVVAELRRAAEGAGDSEAAVAAAKAATQEYKEKLTKAVSQTDQIYMHLSLCLSTHVPTRYMSVCMLVYICPYVCLFVYI